MTNILGIETSCDETSVSIVENGRKVLSNIIRTQDIHKDYGGVVPDISSREHVEFISIVAASAVESANLSISEIDAVCAANGPGLVGSLMIGLMFAKGISIALDIPLITVDHIKSHIYANFLKYEIIEFPFIALVVSGGHTSLFVVKEGFSILPIGRTLDDAAGEAFDKCAKMLDLGYPGGPLIQKHAENGNGDFHKFPVSDIDNYDFSYSGLKTSVMYYIREKGENFIKENINHICASIQSAIVKQLINKIFKASEDYSIKNIALAGGVSANAFLRDSVERESAKRGINHYYPDLIHCTDNAAMIAGFGYMKYQKKEFADLGATAYSRMN